MGGVRVVAALQRQQAVGVQHRVGGLVVGVAEVVPARFRAVGGLLVRLGQVGLVGEHDEHLCRLGAGRGAERLDGLRPVLVVKTREHARGRRPREGLERPGVGTLPVGGRLKRHGVGVGGVHARPLGIAPGHHGKLLAADGPVGAEAPLVDARGVAGDHARLHAPVNRRLVPRAKLHIVKQGTLVNAGHARHAPQHHGHLGACELVVGAEKARELVVLIGVARHEPLVKGLVDPCGIPLALRHVAKVRRPGIAGCHAGKHEGGETGKQGRKHGGPAPGGRRMGGGGKVLRWHPRLRFKGDRPRPCEGRSGPRHPLDARGPPG